MRWYVWWEVYKNGFWIDYLLGILNEYRGINIRCSIYCCFFVEIRGEFYIFGYGIGRMVGIYRVMDGFWGLKEMVVELVMID